MAIKIVEEETLINQGAKYKVTCPVCGTVVEYLKRDVSIHRRFPNGFVYCPRCKNPLAHNEDNSTGDIVNIKEEDQKKRENRIAIFIVIVVALMILALIVTGILLNVL